jgi:hypothetical protein
MPPCSNIFSASIVYHRRGPLHRAAGGEKRKIRKGKRGKEKGRIREKRPVKTEISAGLSLRRSLPKTNEYEKI